MSNQIVATYFESRLKTWADAQVPPVDVAWEHVAFTRPDDDSLWIEPILIPNMTMNKELSGSRSTQYGLYQVNCWAPEGEGMGRVRAMAQAIVDLFPIVPKSGDVSVEGTPTADRPIKEDNWVAVPVLIKYRLES